MSIFSSIDSIMEQLLPESLKDSVTENGLLAFGAKLLEIIGILFLCWVLIRLSKRLVKRFLDAQVQKKHLAMSERKADTLNSVTGSILKYLIYFIGLAAVLKQLGVPSESLVVIASAGSLAIGLGA